MKYDLSNQLHRQQIRDKVDVLLSKHNGIVEIKEIKPQRTMKQNSYLHLIINFFAAEYGENAEFVKEQYFKIAANKPIFVREKNDKILGTVTYIRSSSDLDKEEMQLAIERFRNWSSINAGIYLPSADEQRLLQLADIEVSRNKEFL